MRKTWPPRLFFVLLSGCFFGFSTPAAAQSPSSTVPFNLTADSIQFEDVSGTQHVIAEGGVEVTGAEGNVKADRIVYDIKQDTIRAYGNVNLKDSTGNVLVVDEMELTGSLKAGTADHLRLSIPVLGEVMQAQRAEMKDDGTYQLTKAAYSPCKECVGGRKPWTMHAQKVTYDPAEGEVRYRNAYLDAYGVPVLYLPYFEHPIGPRRPKNGLLPPQFGHSTTLGDSVTGAAYYFNPRENADYTFRTKLMSSRGAQVVAERRQTGLTTDSEVRATFLNDNGAGPSTGHLRSSLDVEVEKVFQEGRRIGLNGEIASDDTYLNEFFGDTQPYLNTTLYGEEAGEDASGDHYLALSTTRFQDLDITRDPASTAQILPHLQMEKMVQLDIGGQLLFSADTLSLYRSQGIRSRRVTTRAAYTRPWMLVDGSRIETAATLRGDIYNVDGSSTENGTSFRGLPEVTLMWEKPYISAGGYHTIAPRVMAALSPRGGNPDGIPNEDSVAYELDYTNLFEPSRFAGLDRVESGPRLMYGLDNRWGTADATRWRFFAGQSVRKFDDVDLPVGGGASKNVSDWVGLAQASPADWMDFFQSFRLDGATFKNRRMDTGLRLGYADKARLQVNHTFLNNGPEELSTEMELPLTDTVSFIGKSRQDLADSRTLLSEGGLVFKRDCYKLEFVARRNGFENGDLRPSTDYLVNIELLTMGDEND